MVGMCCDYLSNVARVMPLSDVHDGIQPMLIEVDAPSFADSRRNLAILQNLFREGTPIEVVAILSNCIVRLRVSLHLTWMEN